VWWRSRFGKLRDGSAPALSRQGWMTALLTQPALGFLYVAFYFGPRSVMLYQLHTGWVEGYREGQEPLIHLVSTSQAVEGAGLAYFLQESGESLAPGPPGATPSCSSSEGHRLERVCRLC